MFEALLNKPLIEGLHMAMLAVLLGTLRFVPIIMVMPPFNMANITMGLLRGGVLLGMSLFFFPQSLEAVLTLEGQHDVYEQLLWLLPKEVLVGLIIAIILSAPFWIAFSSGAILDAQSGAQLAGMIDPSLGEETTPHATFFQIVMLALALQAQLFVLMATEILPASYELWPLHSALPEISTTIFDFAARLLGFMLYSALVVILPFAAGLFMIDMGLAYLSRFVPSMNPFFLSMSAKMVFVSVFAVVYHTFLLDYLSDYLRLTDILFGSGEVANER